MNKDEFYNKHKTCPKCGSNNVKMTTLGVIEFDNEDYIDDVNNAVCKDCKWKGKVKDLKE